MTVCEIYDDRPPSATGCENQHWPRRAVQPSATPPWHGVTDAAEPQNHRVRNGWTIRNGSCSPDPAQEKHTKPQEICRLPKRLMQLHGARDLPIVSASCLRRTARRGAARTSYAQTCIVMAHGLLLDSWKPISPKVMRHFLLTTCLAISLGLGSCSNGSGPLVAIDTANQPPIGPSDETSVNPAPDAQKSSETPAPGGSNGFAGSSSTGTTTSIIGPADGGSPAPGGSPVPEPGTMLLVGTGLAGAAFMRRRKQPQVETEA